MQPTFARLALVLGLLSVVGPVAIDMYMPGLPIIARWFGTDVGHAQQTLVAFFLALAVGQPIYGPLADKYGRRRPLLGGLLLYTAASVACVFAPNIGILIALRFLQGFGICSTTVIVRAVIRDMYTGPRAATLLSLTYLLLGISPLVAPLAGSFLLEVLSWQSIFWIFALAGLLGVALIFWMLPETLPPEKRDPAAFRKAFANYGGILFDRRFMSLTLITGLIQTVLFSFVVGSAFFFMGVHHLPPWQYSILFASCAVVGIGLTQLSGHAMRIFPTDRLIPVSVGICASASTILLLLTLAGLASLPVAMLLIYATFAGLAFVGAPGTVLALDPYGDKAGVASALMGTLQFGISALGAGLVGLLFDGTAVPLMAMMSGCALLALLLCWPTFRRSAVIA
jgi:DHA1 family bicyclomycin/chloramphenicol resistance-like MFS transporter